MNTTKSQAKALLFSLWIILYLIFFTVKRHRSLYWFFWDVCDHTHKTPFIFKASARALFVFCGGRYWIQSQDYKAMVNASKNKC